MTDPNAKRPGLLRRFGAIFYDALAVFSVLFVADAIVIIPLQILWGIENLGQNIFFRIYQLILIALFFLWFWTHGGQTLGLRAWHLKVVADNGAPPSWPQATKRLFASILSWLPVGAGFVWMLFDSEKMTWHDRLSGTRVIFSR